MSDISFRGPSTDAVLWPMDGPVAFEWAVDLAAHDGAAQGTAGGTADRAAAAQDATAPGATAQDAALQAAQDSSARNTESPYDSIWVGTEIPVQESVGVERLLLSEDKLYTVLAVVLIIWLGIVYLLLRTDRKLAGLERSIEEGIASKPGARKTHS